MGLHAALWTDGGGRGHDSEASRYLLNLLRLNGSDNTLLSRELYITISLMIIIVASIMTVELMKRLLITN